MILDCDGDGSVQLEQSVLCTLCITAVARSLQVQLRFWFISFIDDEANEHVNKV